MYFRILVNKNGDKFFRTSRLATKADAVEVFGQFMDGFGQDGQYECLFLEVNDEGEGRVLGDDEGNQLCYDVANEAADAGEGAKFL